MDNSPSKTWQGFKSVMGYQLNTLAALAMVLVALSPVVAMGNATYSLMSSTISSGVKEAMLNNTSGRVLGASTNTSCPGPISVSLYPSSPISQFVIGGSNNNPIATFNFVTSSGVDTIQELDFTVKSGTQSAITMISVDGVSAPVIGTSSMITGLNIPVTSNFGGTQVPVTVSYSPVGLNGVHSNVLVQLVLSRVKYLSGNTTEYLPTSGGYGNLAASNSFDLVGSAPILKLNSSGNPLTVGNVDIGSISISADAAGNIIASNIPFLISQNNAVVKGKLQLIDASTEQVAGSVSVNLSTSTVPYTVVLTTDNNIAAGTTKTYNVVIPVASINSSPTYFAAVTVGAASNFTFDDVNGGVNNISGARNGITYIANYPTNTMISQQ
jgi:hypothetical protein